MIFAQELVIDSVNNAISLISKKVEKWGNELILLIPNLITAILVFLFFYGCARLAENLISRIFKRSAVGNEIIRILARIFSLLLTLTGLFFALGILQLDKTVTSLLAGAGIVGLALSFAFQDIATNFVSGFIIALRRPLKVGDMVETNGFTGNVNHISLRSIHI